MNIVSALSLACAILLEVSATLSMKASHGFSKPFWSLLTFALYGSSIGALTIAIKRIDISVAYAIWAAVGTALITIAGMIWYKEPMTILKGISLVLIVAGVVGLNLGGGSH